MAKNSLGHLSPGRVEPMRSVPAHIPRPEYVGRAAPRIATGAATYTPDEIERVRRAGQIAADAIAYVERTIRPGVTTAWIDAQVHEFLVAHDAYPSTLGYRGFPASCCTSVNEIICHGIPDDTVIESGDILTLDVTAYVDGMHGDTARTILVGDVSEPARLLSERTEEALWRGIRAAKPGRPVSVIGLAIEAYARRFGYGVIRDYTGHGVGRDFHTGLIIPHYDAPEYDTVLEVGMIFTIEPMLTLSGEIHDEVWPDDWTVATVDKSLVAQFEHTLVVTDRGADILTLPSDASLDT